MKEVIYKCIVFMLPSRLIRRIQKPIYQQLSELNKSYSQEGEDLILNRFLGNKEKIFYIDVGAHHPQRFSNTKKFYDSGKGRGINIDALPGTKELFDRERPLDINIECGIGVEAKELTYYSFKEPALNTFVKTVAEERIAQDFPLKEEKIISVKRLEDVLQELNIETEIDFLSVDVEGKDLEVLQSNNWEKFRPNIICIEDLQSNTIEKILEGELYKYLKDLNYELVAKSFYTLFFKTKS